MRAILPRLTAAISASAVLCVMALPAAAEDITLTAADNVKVFGTLTRAEAKSPPIILLFHMAGSNRAEYAPITPRLVAAGFTVLAIDQRSGGSNFGARNQTVTALGQSTSYGAALKDLETALVWAKSNAQGSPVLVCGSSYSASLVFLLAAAHPSDVAGIIAFSPGEYLGGSNPVHAAARKVAVPVFVSQSSSSDEVSDAKSILSAVAATTKTQFVPTGAGVHGASSLRDDANRSGANAYWAALTAFLARFKA